MTPQFPRDHLTALNCARRCGGWTLPVMMIGAVLTIAAAGWLLFTEMNRCDPCEWIGFENELRGDW